MIVGKRALITIIVLIIHQILKVYDIDIVREDLSVTLDTILLILAAIFERLGKKKAAKLKIDNEALLKANRSLVDEITKPLP